ncbi:MAG TPA: GntR family transcriptional regulator [Steroidobacteraceae bacterium]
MDEYWATRTGRWRKAMSAQGPASLAERLYCVIKTDVAKGTLPAGALLPPVERVARELMIPTGEVHSAYGRLIADGVIAERSTGVPFVPAREGESETRVGDATQIRFEAALLKAVREAAARGLSSSEATGMFKAAMLRMQEIGRDANHDD